MLMHVLYMLNNFPLCNISVMSSTSNKQSQKRQKIDSPEELN